MAKRIKEKGYHNPSTSLRYLTGEKEIAANKERNNTKVIENINGLFNKTWRKQNEDKDN